VAVKSNAFGSTTLTADDAKKFKNQITYGKPKDAARESLSRGSSMANEFRASRQLLIKIKK